MEVNPAPENMVSKEMQLMAGIAEAQKRLKSGANWFYWIAGLSLVNTAITIFGGSIIFVFGLGFSVLVDVIAQDLAVEIPEARIVFLIVGLVISLIFAGIFAVFGFLANKEKKWAFFLGMGLYALDALFVIWAGDIKMFLFHLFALFGLFGGLRALNALKKIKQETVQSRPNVIEPA